VERGEDIPLLAAHFLEKHARAFRRDVSEFEPDALRALATHVWPGNVRELENAVERAVAVAKGPRVMHEDLPPEISGQSDAVAPAAGAFTAIPYRDAVEQVRDRFTREYLAALMREFKGNVKKAAERAGMERESLHRLIKKHGLHADDYRED
jgi:two-component system, NtrC family, response regulator AtoC